MALRERWQPIFAANDDPADLIAKFRTNLINLAVSYARLVALSIGMKRHGGSTDDPFITRCWHAARAVCFVVVNELYSPEMSEDSARFFGILQRSSSFPGIFLRHGPDSQSVFVTFASAFLVKVISSLDCGLRLFLIGVVSCFNPSTFLSSRESNDRRVTT